jgi:trk system potassium uptake protein TrkA
MNIVIVGCGRVGAFLAGQLDKAGHAVTIVDLDRGSFVHLPQDFGGTTLLGNGTDLDVLRTAGIEKADAVFALTQGDNRNLMAAQIARQIFGVKRVIAKVNDPIRAALYRAHEISTVSRTTILGTLLEAMLMGDAEVGKVLIEKSKQAEAAMAGELG